MREHIVTALSLMIVDLFVPITLSFFVSSVSVSLPIGSNQKLVLLSQEGFSKLQFSRWRFLIIVVDDSF